jgi:hypothetical protein
MSSVYTFQPQDGWLSILSERFRLNPCTVVLPRMVCTACGLRYWPTPIWEGMEDRNKGLLEELRDIREQQDQLLKRALGPMIASVQGWPDDAIDDYVNEAELGASMPPNEFKAMLARLAPTVLQPPRQIRSQARYGVLCIERLVNELPDVFPGPDGSMSLIVRANIAEELVAEEFSGVKIIPIQVNRGGRSEQSSQYFEVVATGDGGRPEIDGEDLRHYACETCGQLGYLGHTTGLRINKRIEWPDLFFFRGLAKPMVSERLRSFLSATACALQFEAIPEGH